jgi:hypothetical protein
MEPAIAMRDASCHFVTRNCVATKRRTTSAMLRSSATPEWSDRMNGARERA